MRIDLSAAHLFYCLTSTDGLISNKLTTPIEQTALFGVARVCVAHAQGMRGGRGKQFSGRGAPWHNWVEKEVCRHTDGQKKNGND